MTQEDIKKANKPIQYEGNNVHFYPTFKMFPTGKEEDIIEDMNDVTLIYDGGELSEDE